VESRDKQDRYKFVKDSGYIEALLEELVSGTVWHFRHEERLMLKDHQVPGPALGYGQNRRCQVSR